MKLNSSRPVRILLIMVIATTLVSKVARGNADSTLTVAPVETKRVTKSKAGMHVGMIAGGIAGAGLFLLGAAASEAFCEYDCPNIKPLGYVGIGAIGLATGALAGALVGGLFGSMIPDDKNVSEAPHPTPISGKRRSIASVSIEPIFGVTTERPENDSGFLARATLIAQLKPWLGMGPEVTYGDLAGGIFAMRGAVYLGSREPGLRPYAVTALGVQHWETGVFDSDVEVLEWGMGGGLAWTPGSPSTHIGLEARYEWSPQNIDYNQAYRFVSTSVVLRHSW